MPNGDLLPIKVLLAQDDFHVRDEAGGSSGKLFEEVTTAVRDRIATQIAELATSYNDDFATSPNVPSVAKVKLKREALAKSHRPDRILSDQTCPIIGVGGLSELFIRVTPPGLRSLAAAIQTDSTLEGRANISTLESFQPLRPEDRLPVTFPGDLERMQRRVDQDGRFKVQLFDHQNARLNQVVLQDFTSWLRANGAQLTSSITYAPSLVVHEVAATGEQLPLIITHRGIRHANVIPKYTALRHHSIPVSGAAAPQLEPPTAGEQYPVIGVIDSGISPSCATLRSWIRASETYVASQEENREHGTFVAGILLLGSTANPALGFDPGGPAFLVDVAALPNGDSARGPAGVLTETDLVSILQEVIPRYRGVVRVWNLSLGSDQVCSDSSFSDLAVALDEIQRENDVQFVLAAGNFEQPPFRTWPPQSGLGDVDRICSPSDSVRSVTVGSLAHAQTVQSVVRVNEPSPFTRRGPGPAYVVKPDIVNYGGNCDTAGNYQATGIRSLDTSAQLAEDIGTSFAAPFVSSLIANVADAIEPAPSLNLVKALIIHSAGLDALGWMHSSGQDIDYVGFGLPTGANAVLFATQSAATLVFEDVVAPGYHFELDPFPYPNCLITGGRSKGKIAMTLVYDPPLDAKFGLEYCRANVTASLGTISANRRTGEIEYHRKVPPDPLLHGQGYEEDLIKYGFKWCPTKSYRKAFSRGVQSDHWKLQVELLHRHDEPPARQSFALVVTIAGEDGQPVYDDLIHALRIYQTQDLQIRSQVRQRLQPRSVA